MKVGNKRNSPKIEEAVSKAVDYEVAISDIARRSERRAWFVAFSAVLMALILAAGYFLMLPLKEKVPYLVMADAYVERQRGGLDRSAGGVERSGTRQVVR
jgi:type IV secretion system protein VirB8